MGRQKGTENTEVLTEVMSTNSTMPQSMKMELLYFEVVVDLFLYVSHQFLIILHVYEIK